MHEKLRFDYKSMNLKEAKLKKKETMHSVSEILLKVTLELEHHVQKQRLNIFKTSHRIFRMNV